MSYILEALKKAERERAQGQASATGDGTAPAAGAPSKSGLLIKILIAALVINALVFAVILLRPSKSTSPAPAAPQAQPAANPSQAALPVSKPAPPTLAPPSRDEPVVEQGVASMDDLGASSDAEAELAKPMAKSPAPAQPARGRVTFAEKPLTPELAEAPTEVVEEEVIEEPEPPPPDDAVDDPPVVASPAPARAAAPPPAAAPAKPATGYKQLGEMSAAYQATFPHFKMEVHVHDAQPQRRFVLIEGKRYREGDSLAQGARLAQIVPEGIVVDYRNEKVLFPIGRH